MPEPQTALLREAADWRLLGLLYECPSGDWPAQVAALAAEAPDSLLKDAAAASQTEATEGMHHSIFGPGGPVPAREVSYLTGIQLGYLLSELSAYYDAFGYAPETAESPDHVSVETGFIAYLKLKQAYALSTGSAQHAEICADAARGFIEEHLSRIAAPFAAALEPVAPPYLVLAGRALLDRVGASAQPASALPPILNPDDADTEIMCGDSPSSMESSEQALFGIPPLP